MRGGWTLLRLMVWFGLGLGGEARAERLNEIRAKALHFYDIGAYREALPLFNEVLSRKPRDIEALNKRGAIYLRLDQPQLALADFDEAIRLKPSSISLLNGYSPGMYNTFTPSPITILQTAYPASFTNRGIALLMLNRIPEAIAAFEQAIVAYQGWPRRLWASPYTGLGNAYLNLHQYERAFRAYDQALQCAPECAVAYQGRANANAALGRLDEAFADLNEAICLDAQAIADRAPLLHMDPDLPRIADVIRERRIVESSHQPRSDANRAQVYDARGWVLAGLGKNQEALDDFDMSLYLDSNYAIAYKDRGGLLVRIGQYERAIKDLDQAIKLDPNRSSSFQNRAAARNGLGQFEAAIGDCNIAILLDKKNVGAYNNRGLAYFGLGQPERALQDFDRVIALAPEFAPAYVTRGNTLARIGRLERAVEDYTAALQLDPNLIAAWVGLGLALDALGRPDEAIHSYDMALRINPRDAEIYFDRGGARRVLGDWEGALSDFDQAIQLDARRAEVYVARGWARFITGRAGAEADAHSYLNLRGPRDRAAPIMAVLGALAARRAGHDSEARAFLDHVMSVQDRHAWPYPTLLYLSRSLAAEALLQAADNQARATEAHFVIGLDRLVAGNRAGAIGHLRWVVEHGTSGSAVRDVARTLLPRIEDLEGGYRPPSAPVAPRWGE
jgi:tetratricopeptide (TPR) repeat protein